MVPTSQCSVENVEPRTEGAVREADQHKGALAAASDCDAVSGGAVSWRGRVNLGGTVRGESQQNVHVSFSRPLSLSLPPASLITS